MWFLKLRMYLLLAVLFAILYAVFVVIGAAVGIHSFYLYFFAALAMMFIQYLIGPKIVEWTMRVRYVKREEAPRLYQMVEALARNAEIPTPRVGVAEIAIPNAFAFGRGRRDGRICVTKGILHLLKEDELRAVLGHEISHLKNRDVLTITLLSVIPMVLYWIARSLLFYGGRRRDRSQNLALVGLAALLFYFITNLLVLYASRIREYFADRGSVRLGNSPSALASALYKLVYGSARMDKEELKEAEGLKAFFVNDPSLARSEIRQLSELDLDRSGTIDPAELSALTGRKMRLGFGDRMFELLSTHPNMLKRVKQLAGYQSGMTD